jgi:hypothetical protein
MLQIIDGASNWRYVVSLNLWKRHLRCETKKMFWTVSDVESLLVSWECVTHGISEKLVVRI